MSLKDDVEWVIEEEGGDKYSNHPEDPGGETKYGISKRAFPDEDIKNLTLERAIELYRLKYWDACRCGDVPPSLGFLMFDTAVNQGRVFAIKTLQRVIRVKDDGVFGPVTLAAVKAHTISRAGVVVLLNEFSARRMYHYMLLDHLDDTFGLGWSRRMIRAHTRALTLVGP